MTLDSVSLDGKRVAQVQGAVLEGSEMSLLGQSYLSRMSKIEMAGERDDPALTLAQPARPGYGGGSMTAVRQQPYLAFAVALLASRPVGDGRGDEGADAGYRRLSRPCAGDRSRRC